MNKNIKRPMSLIASIMNVLLLIPVTIFAGVVAYPLFFAVLLSGMGSDPESQLTHATLMILLLILVILIILYIISFILNLTSFSFVFASHQEYRARRGVIATIIVFNFIFALSGGAIFLLLGKGEMSVFALLLINLIFLVSNVLYIIDLAKEKNRVKKLEEEAALSEKESKEEALKTETEEVKVEENVEKKD